ncbi:hypothetical protein [Lysobacter xanthus]
MPRLPVVLVLLAVAALASAAPRPSPPALGAPQVIAASASGAVVVATCGRGSAELHRRNAQTAARQMLQARRMLPKDFDARFAAAYARDARQAKAMSPAQRKAMCARLEAQGMRFQR